MMVAAQAHARSRQPQLDFPAALFHGLRERTVLYDFTPDNRQAADSLQSRTPQQDAAAGGSRSAGLGVRDQVRRIEGQKEVEKRGNQQPFRKCLDSQKYHERREVKRIIFRLADQTAQRIWRMSDVCIGKPEIVGCVFPGRRDSFIHRPNFSSPARGKLARTVNRNSFARFALVGSFARKVRRAVVAVVVHDHREKLAAIVLLRQRADRAAYGFSLVPRRDDGHHPRPAFQRLSLIVCFVDLPEISSSEEQIQPNSQGKDGDKVRIQSHALLCNKSAPGSYARSSLRIGKRRSRLPVAAYNALQIAGAITGTVGSPIPVGASVLCTMCTSIGGASFMRTIP